MGQYELLKVEPGEKYFYYIDKNQQNGSSEENIGMELHENIRAEELLAALEKTAKCFPLFTQRPVIDEKGELYLIQNTLPFLVFDGNKTSVALGTEETNGYMFRVCYDGQKIWVRAHHSLGDGRVIFSFLVTLAYHYLLERGIEIDPENKIVTEDILNDPTLLKTFFNAMKEVAPSPDDWTYLPQNVYNFMEDMGMENSHTSYMINWDHSQLRKVLKELGTTPVPFFMAMVARTMWMLGHVDDHHIVAGLPVDMRGKLPSVSQRNYIANIRLPFYPEWHELPLAEQVVKISEVMEKQLGTSNICSRGRKLETIVENMVQSPILDMEKKEVKESSDSEKKDNAIASTYLLSNVGLIQMPSGMQPYVSDVLLSLTDEKKSVAFCLYTIFNKGSALFRQPLANPKFPETICHLMRELGIDATFALKEDFKGDDVDVSRFMRVKS